MMHKSRVEKNTPDLGKKETNIHATESSWLFTFSFGMDYGHTAEYKVPLRVYPALVL
jgi:hypothetical protein